MKIVSVNVGLPREVTWHGRNVTTGIYKEAVAGRVTLSPHGKVLHAFGNVWFIAA